MDNFIYNYLENNSFDNLIILIKNYIYINNIKIDSLTKKQLRNLIKNGITNKIFNYITENKNNNSLDKWVTTALNLSNHNNYCKIIDKLKNDSIIN